MSVRFFKLNASRSLGPGRNRVTIVLKDHVDRTSIIVDCTITHHFSGN